MKTLQFKKFKDAFNTIVGRYPNPYEIRVGFTKNEDSILESIRITSNSSTYGNGTQTFNNDGKTYIITFNTKAKEECESAYKSFVNEQPIHIFANNTFFENQIKEKRIRMGRGHCIQPIEVEVEVPGVLYLGEYEVIDIVLNEDETEGTITYNRI